MPPRRISVLVVDDSAFMRKAMKRMLGSDPMIKVLGEARDGIEAIEKVKKLKPAVVTLDVKMPDMGGLEALEQNMRGGAADKAAIQLVRVQPCQLLVSDT